LTASKHHQRLHCLINHISVPITIHACTNSHTLTHNRFTALLDPVQDYPGELAPEG